MVSDKYAGFWIRLGAYLLDSLIVSVPSLIIFFVLSFSMGFMGMILGIIVSVIIGWIYNASLESSEKQATIGKQAVSVKVVDYKGKRISFGLATGRYFAKILSALIILIGFFMIGFTEKKQGLHDYIANTYVVEAKK
ncbi:MAG: RDD family protein [Candidatus Aenigmarchaeota archaeon]|nr:RDD family protein [Candidatus Aenigmarchaeota archaeon]